VSTPATVRVSWWRRLGAEMAAVKAADMATWGLFPRLIVLLEVFVLAFWLGYAWFLAPELEALAARQAEEVVRKDEFEHKQRRAAALMAYRAQVAEIESTFGPVLRTLPHRLPDSTLPRLGSTFRAAGVVPERLELGDGKQMREFYAAIPVALSASGRYRDFVEVLGQLSSLPAFPVVTEFELEPDPSGRGVLAIKATIHVHRYLDDEEMKAVWKMRAEGRK